MESQRQAQVSKNNQDPRSLSRVIVKLFLVIELGILIYMTNHLSYHGGVFDILLLYPLLILISFIGLIKGIGELEYKKNRILVILLIIVSIVGVIPILPSKIADLISPQKPYPPVSL